MMTAVVCLALKQGATGRRQGCATGQALPFAESQLPRDGTRQLRRGSVVGFQSLFLVFVFTCQPGVLCRNMCEQGIDEQRGRGAPVG
jgi:hypothetical protein